MIDKIIDITMFALALQAGRLIERGTLKRWAWYFITCIWTEHEIVGRPGHFSGACKWCGHVARE